MWISRKEWDKLQEKVYQLGESLGNAERMIAERNEFETDPGIWSPYSMCGGYMSGGWIGRKTIKLADAVRLLAKHVGAKFETVPGTPETTKVVKAK